MKKSDAFSEAMRLSQTEAGQQLIQTLKSQNSDTVEKAMSQIAAGNTAEAKQTLSALLRSPQIQALLEQLGGAQNG